MDKFTFKRIISIFLSFIMILSVATVNTNIDSVVYADDEEVIASETDAEVDDSMVNIYEGSGYSVEFKLDNKWDSGFNATVTITNQTDEKIENWSLVMPLNNVFQDIWNAVVSDTYDDFYVIKNAGWNQDIPANGSVSFGLTSYEAFVGFPEYYTIIGKKVETKTSDYAIEYSVTDVWDDGLIGQITITNLRDTAIEDWSLSFDYEGEIVQIWDAKIVSHNENIYEILCEDYNQNIYTNSSISFGFKVSINDKIPSLGNVVLSEYNNANGISYIALMGSILKGEKDSIELSVASSDACDLYTFYVSNNNIDYEEIGTDTLPYFLYEIPDKMDKLFFYVEGEYKGQKTKSEKTICYVDKEIYVIENSDQDKDGLCDYIEYLFDSSIDNQDTDGDGLSDYYEVYKSFTDPTLEDTDSNGILDPNEDVDYDGLSNIEEYNYNTEPSMEDSDDDGLLDGEEVLKYNTDPLLEDTDGDTLSDYDEIVIGTNPLVKDTDSNGITDDKEKFEQIYEQYVDDEKINKITVHTKCTGNIQAEMTIDSVMNVDYMSSNVVGLFGEPYEFLLDADFDYADVTFYINDEELGNISIDDLLVLWYDTDNEEYVELDTQIDSNSNTVSFSTNHFSRYMIVDKNKWFEAWNTNIDYTLGNKKYDKHNTVLLIDCSGSMRTNDPITTINPSSAEEAKNRNSCGRILAAKNFINNMQTDDKVGMILFDSSVRYTTSLTNNKDNLLLNLQKVYNSGGTNFNVSIYKAVNMFDDDMLNDPNQCNRIILLSDGDASYNNSYLDAAVRKGITISTVGLGDKVSETTLKSIASYTGGEYYKAYFADELVDIYSTIGFTADFDKTDTDGDGLYDVIETAGIRIQNGNIIYTDPTKTDTDGDGLKDGEEIMPILLKRINGGYYFIMRSNPNSKDGDGDGYTDKEEINTYKSNPNDNEVCVYSLSNDFLRIYYEGNENWENKNGGDKISYGGNQGWFYDAGKTTNDFIDSTIEDYGCGLISASDILYYMTYHRGITTPDSEFIKYNSDGTINYDSYISYIRNMRHRYFLVAGALGVFGTEIASGNKCYFFTNDLYYSSKWCTSKKNRLKRIKEMLNNDIPVTLSISNRVFGDELNLYYINDKGKYEFATTVKDHYVTVTAVYVDKVQNKTMLEISTWGKKRYINYSEYEKYASHDLDALSNIVYIYKK